MTTISISGTIVSVDVEPYYSVSTVTLVPSSGHVQYPYNSPFIINPSGSPVTAILFDDSALYGLGYGVNYFQVSSTFNIGDVVEVYRVPGTANGGGVTLNDESGNNMPNLRIRKVQSSVWVSLDI